MKVLLGKFKGKTIKIPPGIRPTGSKLKQAFFNICKHKIENSNFLDLFAGSGAMGIEALSLNANKCIFVEKNKKVASYILENIKSAGITSNFIVINAPAFQALKKIKIFLDIIYIDPPYEYYTDDFIKNMLESCGNLNLNPKAFVFFEIPSFDKTIEEDENFKLESIHKYGSSSLLKYVYKSTAL